MPLSHGHQGTGSEQGLLGPETERPPVWRLVSGRAARRLLQGSKQRWGARAGGWGMNSQGGRGQAWRQTPRPEHVAAPGPALQQPRLRLWPRPPAAPPPPQPRLHPPTQPLLLPSKNSKNSRRNCHPLLLRLRIAPLLPHPLPDTLSLSSSLTPCHSLLPRSFHLQIYSGLILVTVLVLGGHVTSASGAPFPPLSSSGGQARTTLSPALVS